MKSTMKFRITFFVFLAFHLPVSAQKNNDFIPFINSQHEWVDSVYKKLNKNQRIAQLFMVRAHSNLGQKYSDSVARVIKKEQLGGIVLFQGGPIRHAKLINKYQSLSEVPLLVAMDGEWGLGMRMPDSTISFPYQMTLGAIQNENLIYEMGQEIAKDFKRLGLSINFAPVVDINNNPRNPVINYRSFGENKENVASKAEAYMNGMMDEGILITLKHFPGHGDTDIDSHHDLPTLGFSKERLYELEMFPFKKLIEEGASGVMIAHMNIPDLDSTPNLPSSLSKPIITDILKNELGFRGLVFTDAMDMTGVVKYFKNGEADVRAIIAGNDVLELSQNSKRAIKMVKKAIRNKRIDKNNIETRIKKVLATKYWMGLDNLKPVDTLNLYSDLHRKKAELLNQTLADNAVTLLIDENPIRGLSQTKKTAIISIGASEISTFQKEITKKYQNSLNFVVPGTASIEEVLKIKNELKGYEQIIVALHDFRPRPASTLNYNTAVKNFISAIAEESIICSFSNPYALASLKGIENAKSLLIGYQNDSTLQKAGAKVLLNEIQAKGKLPITINSFFKYGDGL